MHGWGGSCDSFLGLAKYLQNGYRITLVDFYGFGDTPHPSAPLTVDDYVLSIVKIIRHYKMENVSLVCHSFGGRVGIKLAAKYGYLLDKLILVDSAGILPRRAPKYYYKILKHKILTKLKVPHTAGSDDYKNLCGTMRETFKNVVREDLSVYLSKITLPTLLIWGNKDKDTPIYMARKIRKKIRQSKLFIFCGCGHYAYVEKHATFCHIVESFLSEGENVVDNIGFSYDYGRNRTVKIPDAESKQRIRIT